MCWISIETQLPEDPGPKKVGTAVDVFGICALFNVGRREADCSYQNGKFWKWDPIRCDVIDISERLQVTHWRHPPAPPEGM